MKIKSIGKSIEMSHTYDLEIPDVHEYLVENNFVSHNSSVTSNSTNGIEPPRDALSYKKSKAGSIPILVPGWDKYKKFYEFAYDIGDNTHNLNIAAAIVKWLDMGISTNVYYRYGDYVDGKLPDMTVIKDIIYAYKMGIPTLYYCNTDASTDMDGCASGACSI